MSFGRNVPHRIIRLVGDSAEPRPVRKGPRVEQLGPPLGQAEEVAAAEEGEVVDGAPQLVPDFVWGPQVVRVLARGAPRGQKSAAMFSSCSAPMNGG